MTWSMADIPISERFADLADLDRYGEVPDDWHVLVADIEGSTAAIRAGRYKDVNLVGVSAIAAVVNAVRPESLPFVFGGDGATFCAPPSALPALRRALSAVKAMSRDAFDLGMRIGSVPVSDIRAAGSRVLVARHRVSPVYVQAMFTGGGLRCAETLVKDPATSSRYAIADEAVGPPDCAGLECRWQEIPSPHGETIALLVQATSPDATLSSATYRAVCEAIDRFYGGDERSHPITALALRLGTAARAFAGEGAVRSFGRSFLSRWWYRFGLRAQIVVGRWLLATGARFAGVDWGKYRDEVVANTDRRKFDDTLRVVLAGTAAQRESLMAWLDDRQRAGELVYGAHVSDAALMTCLIGERQAGEHLHFVDAAGGGYALAAVDLKKRLKG